MVASSGKRLALTNQQLARFDREGYLVVDDVFQPPILKAVEDELTHEIDARARKLVAEGKLSQTYAGEDFAHRLAKISAETGELAGSIWDGALCGPAIFNLICYPRLLDVIEQFCGQEIIASSVYRVRPKVPKNPKSPVPWHQDSGYFEPYCDKALVLTVWLPLVDATEENGCLWVKPGAHKGAVLPHIGRKGKPYLLIADEDLPPVPSVCVPVKKGGALLMSNLLPHASFENKTDMVRWSMDLRYQSASLPTNADVSRLPGEAIGGIAGVPLACYPPEADFLVRSQRRPNEVLADSDAFQRLRQMHKPGPLPQRWQTIEV